ncbi:hypothetical protein EON64_11055 [archaeon]|nr:MAG: hypothetical protein EON64_11055 [archaeon]
MKNEIHELEQLLAATGQTSQSTLLLKKRKEMREVDESLEVMKKDHKKRMDECEERRLQFEIKQAKMREQVLYAMLSCCWYSYPYPSLSTYTNICTCTCTSSHHVSGV